MPLPMTRRQGRRSLSLGKATRRGAVLVALLATGCVAEARVPDPGAAVEAYVEALERGDAAAVHALLSQESQRSMSVEELERVMEEQKGELREHAASLASKERSVTAHADVRYDDGEVVTLDLDGGTFGVTAADAFPAAAKTPEQALGQLRRVLARRSYPGLLRVLSPATRAAVERDLRSLVEGLERPEGLDVDVRGDEATVSIPGGHRVVLRRVEGIWFVEDLQ